MSIVCDLRKRFIFLDTLKFVSTKTHICVSFSVQEFLDHVFMSV